MKREKYWDLLSEEKKKKKIQSLRTYGLEAQPELQ